MCQTWGSIVGALLYKSRHATNQTNVPGNIHYENLPMQYTEIFFTGKNRKFSDEKF